MLITIGRQAGTNGSFIARMVAERLSMRYYDGDLLDEIARRMDTDPKVVAEFDEKSIGAMRSIFLEWRSSVNEMAYNRALQAALKRIGAEDNAVILGRGANYVLTCLGCLHIRLIGPLELRAGIYRAQHGGTETEARHAIFETDQRRAQFVRNVYRQDIADPAFYDLVINLAGIGPAAAADLIVHAAEERMARNLPSAPTATLPQHIEMMLRRKRRQQRGPGAIEGELE